MNPSDFVKCYHGLTVTGRLGGTRTAQVYRYFMWGTKGLKKADEIKAKLEKDTLREGEVKRLASVAQASLKDGLIRRIFEGKGSPSDIKTLLEAALISEEVPDDTDSLQAFCDESIGVDCSGFVNAYFRTMNWIGESQSILDLVRGQRKDPTRIQPRDVLYWYSKVSETGKLLPTPDTGKVGHIAVVDSPPVSTGDGLGTMTVCESRGGGIGISTNQYSIKELLKDDDDHVIYRIDCSLKGLTKSKTDRDNYVRVYPCP
ncbi:NlpC/P60 family protein [Acidobacteria bacterium ACD]|nr:MAG: peptidoglycan endopeptidase [Acidobacteriota bacterium]MCE7960125.1 peptidoglycan endopeptidase [Acidobacteria bacterium ACB2]MDL1949752.1 NlpC/P60 family protein [Acidobacteria bacterium ACD]